MNSLFVKLIKPVVRSFINDKSIMKKKLIKKKPAEPKAIQNSAEPKAT